MAGLLVTGLMAGCGKEEPQAPAAEPAEETTQPEATAPEPEAADAAAYDPASFDPAEVYVAPEQKASVDISGCDTFTQIVDKLEDGKGYANVTIGDADVLMVTDMTYEWEPGLNAAIDADIFYYNDGVPTYLATVGSGGTANPLAVKDGALIVASHHFIGTYAADNGSFKALEEAYVKYDTDGSETYYYKTADSNFTDHDNAEAQSRFEALFGEVEGAEIINFQPVGGASSGASLPAYEYPGPELFYSVLYQYLTDTLSEGYEKADVSIPCPIIIAEDDSDKSDIRVYGNFCIYNYNLNGDVLENVSGGSYPGCVHIKQTDEGYEVTSMDVVEDGSGFTDSAKKIFGDHYDDYINSSADEKAAENTRAQIVANYAAANNLSITAYQDYGWDPVTLPEENIDSFYSILN